MTKIESWKNQKLASVANQKVTEVNREYDIIQLVLGLKIFTDRKPELNTKFVGAELELKRETKDANGKKLPLKPDFIFQSNENGEDIGLPVEVKASLSDSTHIVEELKKMQRYDEELTGWDTKTKLVNKHGVIFAPNAADGTKALSQYKKICETGEFKFSRPFAIWQWAMMKSPEFGKNEVIIIQQLHGEIPIKKLNDKLQSTGIELNLEDSEFLLKKEKVLFTRKKPAKEYTMVILWTNVLGVVKKEDNTVTVSGICDYLNQFDNPLMNGVGDVKFKVKKDWISEALETLEKLELAKKKDTETFEILFDKKIPKQFKEYICKRLARLEKKPKTREKGQEALKT